ncbi:MAG: hypothetical protein LBE36_10830 [Flavobacteriaceae bacterium]|nr:hypothetical protein [Flavobacteriaceae bacterium]
MFYILISVAFLLPVFAGIGRISQLFFGKIWDGISGKIVSGIMWISLLWTAIAFFVPINFIVEISTLIIGFLGFFYFKLYRNFWDFFTSNFKFFIPIAIIIIFAGSFFPFILDHFGYYVPTIKWISEFGLVKGISNLDLLLGQMSVWHIFQAGFSHFSDPFLRMNTIVLIVYLIYIFEKKSWIHLLFVPVLFLFSQSPSPDLPAIVFSLILLNEILLSNKNISAIFAVSVLIFAIKPTMMWIPILVLLYGIFILKSNLKFIFIGSLVLILFFIKNLWCFGFPVFPVQIADFGLSWKPNPELLKISSQVAVLKTFDMQYSYAEIQNFSVWEHIKNWLFLKGIKSKIHLLFVASFAVFAVFSLMKKKKIIALVFISIFIKSALVLLFSAQYRFFTDVFFVIVFVMLFDKISKQKSILAFSVFAVFFLGFLAFPNLIRKNIPSFRLGQFMTGFQKSQILKPAHFQLNKYKTHQIGNLKFNIVKGYFLSFDTPIPAISPGFLKEYLDAGIFPQKNSENLKDGFRWRKLSDSEKKELQKIMR